MFKMPVVSKEIIDKVLTNEDSVDDIYKISAKMEKENPHLEAFFCEMSLRIQERDENPRVLKFAIQMYRMLDLAFRESVDEYFREDAEDIAHSYVNDKTFMIEIIEEKNVESLKDVGKIIRFIISDASKTAHDDHDVSQTHIFRKLVSQKVRDFCKEYFKILDADPKTQISNLAKFNNKQGKAQRVTVVQCYICQKQHVFKGGEELNGKTSKCLGREYVISIANKKSKKKLPNVKKAKVTLPHQK